MQFNPDPSKQAQEAIFPRKTTKLTHPNVFFNDAAVTCSSFQKHLGMYLDEKLYCNHHINEKISEAIKGIGVTKKLSNYLPRNSFLTMNKAFIRVHLDYGDIMYGQLNNESFSPKIESIQYNAAIVITGNIIGIS